MIRRRKPVEATSRPSAEHPVIFSGPMVLEILAGQKTQTRRVIKPQPRIDPPKPVAYDPGTEWWLWEGGAALVRAGYEAGLVHTDRHALERAMLKAARWQPGDRLWVKEAFRLRKRDDALSPSQLAPNQSIVRFEADGTGMAKRHEPPGRLRSPRFMPRWASRIDLEVVEVSVERVQEISREDAIAEGVDLGPRPATINGEPGTVTYFDPCVAFAHGWTALNGRRGFSWVKNPWIWAITFKDLSRHHIASDARQGRCP